MKRILLLLFLFSSLVARAEGGRMAALLLSMPDSLLPTLTRNARLDLIDFHANGMEARVKNIFDDDVLLTSLTDRQFALTLSEATSLECTLLDESHVLLISTVKSRAAESLLTLTDTAWTRLTLPLPAPTADAFFRDVPDSLQSAYARLLPDVSSLPFVSAHYEADALVFTLHLEEADRTLRESLRPYLSEVKYRFAGGKWSKE